MVQYDDIITVLFSIIIAITIAEVSIVSFYYHIYHRLSSLLS